MSSIRRLLGLFVVASAATFLSGCGGGDSDPTNPGGGNPTPSISINLSGTSLNITAGNSGQVTVSVTRSGGFTGAVTVAADVPTGVTAAPVTIAAGSTSGVLTFQVAGSAAAGTVTATVRATGQGVQQVTAPVSLVIAAAPAQDFSVALGQASATLAQGESVTVPVQITRTNFTGAVTLTASGLPQGVTAAFDPAAPTGNSSTLTLTATAGAATGAVTVTVQGAGTGVGNRTAPLALTVQAPAPSGDYTLTLNPTSVQFQQGGQATTSVNINRTGGFTGTVTLAATGLPQGVTAAFNPASTDGNSATLTLTAGAGATTGAATITVQGTATGVAARSATLGVTVNPGGGGGSGNAVWSFCGEELPTWFAVQDGNGPWTRVTPDAQSVFRFQANGARVGLAWVETDITNSAQLQVAYYSRDEILLVSGDPCRGSEGSKTVNGSVVGLGPLQSAFISLGGTSTSVSGAQGQTAFSLNPVPDGLLDLVASRAEFDLQLPGLVPDRAIIRRGLDAPDGSTLPPLDFDAEGFDMVSGALTVNGLAAGEQTTTVGIFTTQRGALGTYSAGILGGANTTFWGMPTDRLQAGDLHLVQIVALDPTAAGAAITPPTRTLGVAFREVEDRTVTLGPVHTMPTVTTVATAPYARMRAEWTLQPEYDRTVFLFFTQAQGLPVRSVTILASDGFLATSSVAELEVPDLSGVDGWDNAWGLVPGVNTLWTVSGTGWQGPGFINFPEIVNGTVFFSGTRSGSITP